MKKSIIIVAFLSAWIGVAQSLPANTIQIQNFFNRMVALPSQSMQTNYANLIGGMKSAGIADLCPAAYFYATFEAGASLLNLNSALYKAQPFFPNSVMPTFTVNQGWTGGGSESYIDTNYNPTAAADGLYTLNGALLWWYSAQASSTSAEAWVSDPGKTRTYFANNADGSIDWTVNASSAKHLTSTPKDGFFVMKRTGASAMSLSRNGVQIDSSSIASSAIPTGSFQAPYGTGNSLAAFGVCGLLSAGQEASLYALVAAAAQAVGL